MFSQQTKSVGQISASEIPFLHPKIDLNDLHRNGKLLTENEIEKVRHAITKPGRYSKRDIAADFKYPIIYQAGKYIALYKKIGDGKEGCVVKLAQDIDSGEWLVLKIQLAQFSKHYTESYVQQESCFPIFEFKKELHNFPDESMRRELTMLMKMDQAYKDTKKDKPISFSRYSHSKERDQFIFLMKLAQGDEMYELIIDHKWQRMPIARIMQMIVDTAEEIKKIHAKHVIHRDIKDANVIYDLGGKKASIIDFGFALEAEEKLEVRDAKCYGTEGFCAPEILNNSIYNERTEIFALGTLIGMMFQLAYPDNSGLMEIGIFSPAHLRFRFNNIVPNLAMRREIRDFLVKMRAEDPAQRPTVDETIKFFTDLKERRLDPASRVIKVALLDVRDYLDVKGDRTERANLIEKLKSFDEVWLMDALQKPDLFRCARVKKRLIDEGVIVEKHLFHGMPIHKLRTSIPVFISEQDNIPFTYTYAHVLPRAVVPVMPPRMLRERVASGDGELSASVQARRALLLSPPSNAHLQTKKTQLSPHFKR